ncbi:MAG: phosphate regulon sensor histidine kinase PhoR [Thiotrichales bacterium]|nr:phosphate regulon sensor histidine kinase PhoR [Thiotrichales bacterium]
MNEGWQNELLRFAFWLLGGLIVGAIVGYPHWGVASGSVLYLIQLLYNLKRLLRWLNKGAVGSPPDVTGVSEQIADLIYQRQRRNLKRRRRLANMVSNFRDSMANIPDGLVLMDEQRNISWFNNAARQFLGLKYPTDINQRIDNLVRHPTFTDYILAADHQRTIEIDSPMSAARYQEMRVLPFGDSQQLLIVRDASLLHRLQKVRSDFVINASHELRTPLTVMRGYMEAVDGDESVPEDLQYPLQQVSRQVTRMDRLVNDLLELANLERDDARLHEKRVNVPSLIESLMKEARALSGDSDHEFSLQIDESIGLYADEKAIFSALSNLVFNAIHYTPAKGKIIISWKKSKGDIQFFVEDNGPGIAEQHLVRLSERFYRVDVSRSRDTGGTGLGLSIVRHVMVSHDGELNIESELGKGSRFICRFPKSRIRILADGNTFN